MTDNPPHVRALIRFAMNSPDGRRLSRFYETAFGATVIAVKRLESNPFVQNGGFLGGAVTTVLNLGDSTIEIWEYDTPGRPCPQDLSPYDTRFQHLGIVVRDMRLAMERLSQTNGWSSITVVSPQTLPDNDGDVCAFKFRDPDGHPLEFLQFAAGKMPPHWRGSIGDNNHLGIDHSALSVAEPQRSVRFYESLRLRTSHRTLNQGAAQERLDGVPAPIVDVISLAPTQSTPHVELLHYHTQVRPRHPAPHVNDIAATRLIFSVDRASDHKTNRLIQDPDGHFLQFAGGGEP